MKRIILSAIFAMCILSSGCMLSKLLALGDAQIGGTKTSKTNIAGAIVEKAEVTGAKIDAVKLEGKAEVTATGADLSKTVTVGGNQTIMNDSDLMLKIFQGLSSLFLALLAFMKAQMAELNKQVKYLTASRLKYQDRFLSLLSPEYKKLVDEEKEG